MYLGGKCKISWSNDDLERFYKSGHFEPPPRESITSQGAGVDRVNDSDLKFVILKFCAHFCGGL